MHLTSNEVGLLTEETFREFMALGVPEGVYLDYKLHMKPLNDAGKKELLKDISGFANAVGGMLVFGALEPKASLTPEERMVGTKVDEKIARQVEQIAASGLDPQISGLRFKLLEFADERCFLIVYVPSSFTKPHMVVSQGYRGFHIRHSESTTEMDTHEIRESVLSSATAEGKARQLARDRIAWNASRRAGAYFLLQAVPLTGLPRPWEVRSTAFDRVWRGYDRVGEFKFCDLKASSGRPTIDGWRANGGDWQLDISQNGHLSLVVANHEREKVQANIGVGLERTIVSARHKDVFFVFAHVIRECLHHSQSELPFLMTCLYTGADYTYLRMQGPKFAGPFEASEIVWPEHIRFPGENPANIAEEQFSELFFAFGGSSKG